MSLSANAQSVKSRSQFVEFVRQLKNDFELNSKDWENHSIDAYLEAIASWVEDIDGYFENRGEAVPDDVHWELFSSILIAAKYYE